MSGQPRGKYKDSFFYEVTTHCSMICKSIFSARSVVRDNIYIISGVVPLFAAVLMCLSDRNRSANGCDWTNAYLAGCGYDVK